MNSERITFQVNFWALIGPFICLLTMFVFFIKDTPTPFTLPLSMLLGVPLCWKWKLKGFAGGGVCVALAIAYHYTDIPLEERFWHLGMGISTILSLLITALSFEEVEVLIEGIKVESRSRLENLWKVDEKLQQSIADVKKKKEKIREGNVKLSSYQKLLDRSVEEMVELRAANRKTTQELEQTRKDLEELQQKQNPAHHLSMLDGEHPQLEEKQQLIEETRKELFQTQEHLLNVQKELDEMKLYQVTEVEEALQRHLVKMESEREEDDVHHQEEIDSLQEMVASLLKP